MQQPKAQGPGAIIGGAVVGALLGFVVAGGLVGLGGYLWVKKVENNVRRGWNLVPVVVATKDLPAGTKVAFDEISQRSVPEQFVTSSVVKPDSASYVVNQRLSVPVKEGQPLRWDAFDVGAQVPDVHPTDAVAITEACADAYAQTTGTAIRPPQSVEALREALQRGGAR